MAPDGGWKGNQVYTMNRANIAIIGMAVLAAVSLPSACYSQDKGTHKTQDKSMGNPLKDNYVIVVKDSTTVSMGSIQSTTTLNVTASNAQTGIEGHYSGSGSGDTVNVNSAYGARSEAENVVQWDFTVRAQLASLQPPDKSNGLASLTGPASEPDWQGSGSMTMAPRTAQLDMQGIHSTKKLSGTTVPINVFINGSKVRLEVKSPRGSIYFNGEIVATPPHS
jgi:hypothetical protein